MCMDENDDDYGGDDDNDDQSNQHWVKRFLNFATPTQKELNLIQRRPQLFIPTKTFRLCRIDAHR